MRVLAVWMVFAWISSLAPAGALGRPGTAMTVDRASGFVAVPVTVGAGEAHPWMVDTGSSRSAVNETLAARLGLPVVARTVVVTASGTEILGVVRLPEVAIGGVSAPNLMAMVLPDDRLPGVHGLLGQDFLGKLHYTLDYGEGRFEWGGPGGQKGDPRGERLPLISSEGRFLVDLPSEDGEPLRMVPDSGAAALVLFRKPGRSALPPGTLTNPVELRGVAGTRTGVAVRLPELRIGSRILRDLSAVLLDAPSGHAWPEGLLPLRLFERVTLNAPEGYLVVE